MSFHNRAIRLTPAVIVLAAAGICMRPRPVELPPTVRSNGPTRVEHDHGCETVAAVFTGTSPRVVEGLQLLKLNYVDHLLISGVGNSLDKTSFAKKFGFSITPDEAQHITLDHAATNTAQNANVIQRWMVQNPDYCRLILVTSDDHIKRAFYLEDIALKENVTRPVVLFIDPVNDHESNFENQLKVLLEGMKLGLLQSHIIPNAEAAPEEPIPLNTMPTNQQPSLQERDPTLGGPPAPHRAKQLRPMPYIPIS